MEMLTELAEKIGKSFEEGAVVFHQGDPGDTMYILYEGTLAVIREKDGSPTVVARLVKGDVVGEMALVDGGPRSATVKAMERCILVPITRDFLLRHSQRDTRFILTLIQSLSTRLERVNEMLRWRFDGTGKMSLPAAEEDEDEPRSAAFLKSLGTAVDTSKAVKVGRGDLVFSQGDPGDAMYIVLDGRIEVYQEKGASRHIHARLGRGNFFGEMALVSHRPRTATAAAEVPAVLLPVDRDVFLERVRTDPAVALHAIEILILRLRRSLRMLN